MSKQELATLLELANISEGRAQEMAVDLFIGALKKIDRNLIDSLDVAYQSLNNTTEIAGDAYKAILVEARDQIVKLNQRVNELTHENAQLKPLVEENTQLRRLQTPEGLFEEVLNRAETFNSSEEILIILPRYGALFERLNRLASRFDRPGLSSLAELSEKMQITADKFATS